MNDFFSPPADSPAPANGDDFFAPMLDRKIDYGVRGGYRPGAGRKSRAEEGATVDTPDEQLTDYQRKVRAAADKEEALARREKVKADTEEGAVVSRDFVAQAAARAFTMVSQTLDSIPDHLERKAGLNPDQLELVAAIINESKSQLAKDMKKAYEQSLNDAIEEESAGGKDNE